MDEYTRESFMRAIEQREDVLRRRYTDPWTAEVESLKIELKAVYALLMAQGVTKAQILEAREEAWRDMLY